MDILRLKELMAIKGMTGKDLATKVNVTPASISNIVQGNSFPKPELLLKIAEVLEVDIRELFHPTKGDTLETIYTLKNGQYTPVGKLSLKIEDNG